MNIGTIEERLDILDELHRITKQMYDNTLYYDGYSSSGNIIDERLAIFDSLIPRIYAEKILYRGYPDSKNKMLKDNAGTINDSYSYLDNYPLRYTGRALYKKGSLKEYINTFQQSDLDRFIQENKTIYPAWHAKIANAIRQNAIQQREDDDGIVNGGKRISKGKSNKVAKKPVVSQKKQSVYKEIFGKQMKIYKMPDSRKEYVKYKGELHPISEYKSLMKQKALAKTKAKK
jgi:hypothetical protein